MRYIILPVAAITAMISYGCTAPEKPVWQPADNPIVTRWTAMVNPAAPWPEYPRPGLVRNEWMNLNGLWDYAITGREDSMTVAEGKILVPYPVESALSGVKKRVSDSLALWYSRQFSLPKNWYGKQIMLNFEASDWETHVWIDGNYAGIHRGGYDPFSFNITPLLSDSKKHRITVRVWDPTDRGKQPRGKQVSVPGGIWYTPSTGIWQTVWLEPVGMTWISCIKLIPDAAGGTLSIVVSEDRCSGMAGCPPVDMAPSFAEVTVTYKGQQAGSASGETGKLITVKIPDPHLWSPENPNLYDVTVKLISGGTVSDEVTSYAGLRDISLGKTEDGFTRIMLNGSFVWQNGPLDQGFWPDGIYTPPADEAMVYDIEMLKKMGFNMLRKHVKVENRRYYYHTDRLGMIVWQDMPSGDDYIWGDKPDIVKTPADSAQFVSELSKMIDTKYNNPSVIMWVIYNEGWGQYNTAAVTSYVSGYDSTRLVNSASGWTDRGTGHVKDIHNYPDPLAPAAEENRAIVLGEFGGLGLPVMGHTWEQKNWGYAKMSDSTDLLDRYEAFYSIVRDLVAGKGLSASVYTQTTDVETETNGLMTYDREVDKMGYENVRKAMSPK